VAGHTGSPFNTDSAPQWSLDSNATRYATLSNPYPNALTLPLRSSQGDSTFLGLGAGTIVRSTGQNPELYNWNASIQREVGWDSLIEINYTGNRGVKLPDAARTSLSLLDPGNWLGANAKYTRQQLQAAVANPFYGIITDPKATNLNRQTVQLSRLLRPMPQFDGANGSEISAGDSWYQGLQVRWEKRFSKGLSMLAHYTWSKMLDTVSNGSSNLDWLSSTSGRNLQSLFNYKLEKSYSSNDVPHRFVLTGVYQLPLGHDRQFANNLNRALDAVIGGWEAGGFFTIQSSQPLQVTQNGGTLQNGTQRPNLIGNPATSGSVYDRFNNWFNVAAFSQPLPDTYGTAPRFLNLGGPKLNTLDVSLSKSWRTTEKQRLEFRAEASNFRNHPVFSPPASTFGSGNFGQISGTKIGSRNAQMSLKYYF